MPEKYNPVKGMKATIWVEAIEDEYGYRAEVMNVHSVTLHHSPVYSEQVDAVAEAADWCESNSVKVMQVFHDA